MKLTIEHDNLEEVMQLISIVKHIQMEVDIKISAGIYAGTPMNVVVTPAEADKPTEMVISTFDPKNVEVLGPAVRINKYLNRGQLSHPLTRLRVERKNSRINAVELAHTTSVSASTYSRIELRLIPVSMEDAITISSVLGVPINELFDDRGFAIVVTPPARKQT